MVCFVTDDGAQPCSPQKAIINVVNNVGIPTKCVQAIYAPSKLQEEMILATMMDPNHRVYMETYHFTTPQVVTADRLYDATHAIARRHAVLRSIFCWNDSAHDLESSLISMMVLDVDYVGRQGRLVREYPSSASGFQPCPARFRIVGHPESAREEEWLGEMPWKISVAPSPDGQGSFLSLSYHHALMDGTTARQLLLCIQEEIKSPGSVETESNFFVACKELESRCSPDIQIQLREKLSGAKAQLTPLGEQVSAGQAGQAEQVRRVLTEIPARAGLAAVPAWMARLALAMALCTFQGTTEAVFLEIKSGRGLLSPVSQRVLGPVLVSQLRWVDFRSEASLLGIAQSLRSAGDIDHAFSTGQLRSFFPELSRHLEVCLVCQTNESYPSNGVGDWAWSGREAEMDIPLVVELLPPQQSFFDVSIRYDRRQFKDETISAFQTFFCTSLEWLQDVHTELEGYDLPHAVDRIRVGNRTLDSYIGSTKTQAKSHSPDEWQENPPNLLSDEQQRTLDQWSRLATPFRTTDTAIAGDVCAHQIVEWQASKTPQKIAVQYELSEFLTYGELDDRCNRVAGALGGYLGRLRAESLDEQDIIPICFDKGVDMVVAILATLKSGAAYSAIDRDHPADRIASILDITRARVVLCDGGPGTEKVYDVAKRTGALVITLRELLGMYDQDKLPLNLPKATQPTSSLACVQFTSGTTGVPKGVMIEHRNLVAFMRVNEPDYMGNWTSCHLQLANYTFDISISDVFGTLGWGGRLVLGPAAKFLSSLPQWLERLSVTHLLTTPLVADLLEDQVPAHLRVLKVGGEPFHLSLIRHVPKECILINLYGPTETTVGATVYKPVPEDHSRSRIPIGQPLGSSRINILKPGSFERVAIGDVGEICIGGPQACRGYLGQPDLTDSRFKPDPFGDSSNEVLFRTGDLGRWLPDGTIDCLGRMDGQVKLRGQRIEVTEVEMRITECPQVQSCGVVKAEAEDGGALVAFVEIKSNGATAPTGEEDSNSALECIRSHLADTLPQYMVPQHLVKIDSLPRLSSDKVDRRELSSRATSLMVNRTSQQRVKYASPQDNVEKAVCDAFSEVLSCQVGVHDNFLDLGGHSITAIRAATRINRQLGTEVTFREILDCPSPASLCIRIRQHGASTDRSLSAPKLEHSEPVEQSFAQGRLWFLEQLHANLNWYLMIFAYRVRGPLRLDALEGAFSAIEKRHDTLRTTFEEKDGVNLQVVRPFHPKGLRVVPITGDDSDAKEESLRRALLKEQTTPFDLRNEAGWRPAILQMNPQDNVVSIVIHHIDPLAQLPPLPLQYREYSLWQRQEVQLAKHQQQLEYWAHELEGSKPAEFYCDKRRPEVPSGQADVVNVKVKGALYHALQQFCKELQITPFIALLAAFRAAHYRMTGAEDATFGTPITNRNRVEHEGLIGLFVNMQCMRVRVMEDDTFGQLVENVKGKVTAAFANGEVPFETIVSKLQPTRVSSRNPLVQTMFAVHPQRLDRIPLEGVHGEQINVTYATRFDMEFHLYQDDEGLEGEIMFATDLFHSRTIETIVSVFYELLERGLKSPGTQVEDMPLSNGQSSLHDMGLMEIHRREYPRNSSIVDVFGQQVANNPNAIAVKDVSSQLTYSELDQKSAELARWLSSRGYPSETFIAVLAPRSCQTIVAFFGIMKANMAYLPLDLKFPDERVKTILGSIKGPRLVLTGQGVQPPAVTLENLEFVPIEHALNAGLQIESSSIEVDHPTAHSLAQVIYTSGSTGQPKGVLIEHQAIVLRAKAPDVFSEEILSGSFSHMSSIAFDATTVEIYTPLLNGGSVICIDSMTALDFDAVQKVFAREKVRAGFLPPALLSQYLVEAPSAVAEFHTLVVGGERSEPENLYKAQTLVQGEVLHLYGPTENAIFSTLYRMRGPVEDKYRGDRDVPIGRAPANSGAYVMDRQMRIVPLGVMGELVVVGDGLARGYTDPSKTRERFIMVEINGQQVRAYCTGDRARYRPADGQMEFCGRVDDQIKIRGFRVELGEVEHALVGSGLLEKAVVIMKKPEGQEAQLVAFVTEKKDAIEVSHHHDVDGEQEHEEGWRETFSSTTYNTVIEVQQTGRDFVGWTSMYDGKDIDKREMNEWLDDTIATMRNGMPPGHVLEIGTGSGMMLFNLTEGLQRYVGLDPVPRIVEFVQKTVAQTLPDLADRIEVHVGKATDLDKLEGTGIQPDLVVVNSVAQYFPSGDYMNQLIKSLLGVYKAKTLFFGDMRSYALYDQFQVTKALHRVGEKASKSSMRQRMAESVSNETEFLADPAFFTSLPERFPGLIRHVEIIPKRMRATNELSCYRFAAVVHTVHQHGHLPIHEVEKGQWIDFASTGLNREALRDILQQSSDTSVVAIANIPHNKSILERHIVEVLPSDPVDTNSDWISLLRQEANQCHALSALDLVELGRQTGFRVEVSWARQFSQKGGLDAIFHNLQPANGMERTMFRFPTDHEGRPSHEFTNTPMLQQSGPSLDKTLRAVLQKQLPSYMVPAVIKVLDDMPINNNGKIDRRALSQMTVVAQTDSPNTDTTYVAPRDYWERAVCEEFASVLGTQLGIEDNFFGHGGHSLLATRAISKIVRRLGCAISVKDLFDCPTPEALARRISSKRNEKLPDDGGEDGLGPASLPPPDVVGWHEAVHAVGIPTQHVVRVMPCTSFQEGVLSADMALGVASAYRAKMNIEFNTSLNVDILQFAWRTTVEREEMLRTAFLPTVTPLKDNGICSGAFLQAILNNESPEVRRASTIQRATPFDNTSPVDLGVGHIPISLGITQGQRSDQWNLELTIHHALYDEAYLSYVIDGLSRDYHRASNGETGSSLEQHHIPFSAFVRKLQTTDPQTASSFWKKYLHGAPGATWPIASGLKGPVDSKRPPESKVIEWKSNARTISKKLHNTPAGIARAAIALAIATHSDSDDVVLGEVSSGRSHAGFVAGPCIAAHPVRIQLSKNDSTSRQRISLETLLTLARNAYLDTIPHQQFGLQAIRKMTQNPELLPFQVLFVYQQRHAANQSTTGSPSSKFTAVRGSLGQVEFPLVVEVSCDDTTGHLGIRCVFDPILIPPTDVDWILQHVVDALNLVADEVTSGLGGKARLAISANEQKMLQWFASGGGRSLCANAECMDTVDKIIHRQATRTPEKIALQFEDTEYLTYQQLDMISTKIASGIRRVLDSRIANSSKQPLVPIFFKKSVDMVVTIMAVLKAGAAFIPLNIDDPIKRLEAIFDATQPSVLIWDGIHGDEKLEALSHSTGSCLYTKKDLELVSEPVCSQTQSSLDSLAYIVFTSGSTGTPKGVMVEHRNLASFTLSDEGSNSCSWTSNRLALLEYTFDASVGDIFATLCKGGRLSLVKRENLLPRLSGWLDDLCVTHLAVTPTLGALLTDDLHGEQRLAFLNTMVFGGEPFQPSFLRQAPKELTVWNGYGPTETAIEVTACKLQGPDANLTDERAFIPIGKPTRGCQIYLLRPGTDDPVHVGAVGEICIRGPQVARGYVDQPESSASQSTPNPFQHSGQGRMYRTGDLARLHGDGLLEYLGRIDGQVKLRGLRIDLDELSSVAQRHPLVNACSVAKVEKNGQETLIAFVEIDQEGSVNERAFTNIVRNHISQHVPSYMVPDHYCFQTDPLPRTVSGKMDRKAISQMAEEKYESCLEGALNAPDTLVLATPGSLEAKIASLWSHALGVEDDLDITTPFAHMGGDSIRAIVLLALLRQNGLHLSMKDLSQSSTIQMQAAQVRDNRPSNNDGVPDYLHVHRRERSEATIILIHPFLAQSTILEPLVPLLDDRFDVILVDDPFFGKPDCPGTLTEWARSYLMDLKPLLSPREPVFLAGYSIGGLIAFEMALIWQELYKGQPDSVVLLDPGMYGPGSLPVADEGQREIAIRNSLGMLGVEPDNLALFGEHYDRLFNTLRETRQPPVYEGRCLYLALPERLQDGVAKWWQTRCTDLTTHFVLCNNHFELLKGDHIGMVGQLINTHCQMYMSTAASVSPSEPGLETPGSEASME
ncbi:Nonribosomal peptide synthetases (NRPS) [Aspergillus tanneri]|uniref:Nonribosomal peptide synthetases (NRPS) n=1 Tax=Aspergillus tanneri TaxID=1220188 RepID=A0A5M9MSC0_9EURO|nr:Nonribosomal peptide synthetases (NRPS) [Aspergillus tanneri]KAA8648816.1 Nonribosomal peptide synthetases (NRPS) [Aspergillus tanneri]